MRMPLGPKDDRCPAEVRSGAIGAEAANAAAERIRARRQGVTLGGTKIADLIAERRMDGNPAASSDLVLRGLLREQEASKDA